MNMKLSFLSLLVSLSLLLSTSTSSSFTAPPPPPPGWVELSINSNSPSPRAYAASSGGAPVPPPYDPSDRSGLVIFGGTQSPYDYSNCLNDLWIFNPQDQTKPDDSVWYEIPLQEGNSPPPARALAAIAVDSDSNLLYLAGGYNGTTWFNDVWVIDVVVVQYPPTASIWVQLSGFQSGPRCGMSMNWLQGTPPTNLEFFLFGGGSDKRQLFDDGYTYYNKGQKQQGWVATTESTPWPAAREFHTSATVAYAEVFIFGGYDYGFTYYNDTWLIQVSSQGYSTATQLGLIDPPPPRCCNALAWSPNQQAFLIFGGRGGSSPKVMSDMWTIYYPTNSTAQSQWYNVPMGAGNTTFTPSPRYGMVSGWFQQEDALLMWGGADEEGNLLSDAWYYRFADA